MQLIELFKKLLSFHSVTPDDGGGLDFIAEYLSDFKRFSFDKEDTKNLFLMKKFGEGEHLCFAGHIDVVPAGEGWQSDPFEPKDDGKYIYARGAQDMKSGLSAFLYSLKELKHFNGTLSVLITSDEEGSAKYGTQHALKRLKELGMLPDFAIVAEPTCKDVMGDTLKIGRRGSINGLLKLQGTQGHVAYPELCDNPIEKIAPLLEKIAGVNLDNGDENFSPSKLVVTDIRSGLEVVNVTPNDLKLMFNVRNSTKTTKKDIQKYIEKHFKGLEYTLELVQPSKSFVTNEDSKVVTSMLNSVRAVCGVKPEKSTSGGTSDARFFGEFGIDVVEFGPRNDTIHSVNERVLIKEVELLNKTFSYLIQNW